MQFSEDDEHTAPLYDLSWPSLDAASLLLAEDAGKRTIHPSIVRFAILVAFIRGITWEVLGDES